MGAHALPWTALTRVRVPPLRPPRARVPPAAVQTAIVGLHMHPTVVEKGITLLRSAREIKGVGSLDTVRPHCDAFPHARTLCVSVKPRFSQVSPTPCFAHDDFFAHPSQVGKAMSTEIKARAQQTLAEEFEDAPDRVKKYMEVDLDFNDTMSEWWTGTEAVDSDADVEERLNDLFAYMQFWGGSSAILVGHSLLFREIMKRYLSDESKQARRGASPVVTPASLRFRCSRARARPLFPV